MSLMLNSNSDDGETLYSDSVFSTYLYTGNGSTQTINNGIDLAGKGGLLWIKNRTNAGSNLLFDTVRGADQLLQSNQTNGTSPNVGYMSAFTSSSFSLSSSVVSNASAQNYTAWTFRKAAKFFDVVTYTGDGVAGRQIAHSLGCAVGMLIIKRTDASGNDWAVWNAGAPTLGGRLNQAAVFESGYFYSWCNSTAPTSSVFSVGADATVNASGGTYVAYLFAHDTTSTGLIQCGSFTTNASGIMTTGVTLGWEPQYLLFKSSDKATDWFVVDTIRGNPVSGNSKFLFPNSNATENGSIESVYPTATGFTSSVGGLAASATYIYMAIRRPNKPPTSGTEIFYPSVRTGTGAASSILGLPISPDLIITQERTGSYLGNQSFVDRLRGGSAYLNPRTTTAEGTFSLYNFGLAQKDIGIIQDNYINENGGTFSNLFFKRAPGFFDIVCYTGTGIGSRVLNHSLNAVPELMIFKSRTTTGDNNWSVYCTASSAVGKTYNLNTTSNYNGTPVNTLTTTSITLSDNTTNNTVSYVAYLFATLAGVSKVGSYTGNNGSQIINCGFAAGARFILIKRTDAAGDWYVWDTARGIVPATDPHLSLNTTAAEVTTDNSIDPDNTGFIVNQVAATNINVTSATYIFLAIS